MTDTNELKAQIVRKGLTLEKLAKEIGMSRQALSNKIHNKVQFNQKEIYLISNVLELTVEQKSQIFLGSM